MAQEETVLETLKNIQIQLQKQGETLARFEKGQQELTKKVVILEEGQKEQGAAIVRIEKKLSIEITGNAEALHEISMKLNQLDDHEERIKQLEEDSKFLPH